MSYLGRVARRAATPGGAPRLTPSRGRDSPLARLDQRLNMPSFAAIADSVHIGGVPPSAVDDAPTEAEAPSGAPPPVPAGVVAPAPSIGARPLGPGQVIRSSGTRDAAPSPGPFRAAPSTQVVSPPASRPDRGGSPAAEEAQPPEPVAPARRSEEPVRADRADAPPPVRSRATAENHEPANPLTPEVRSAFERLDAWLRSEPGARRTKGESAAVRSEVDTAKVPASRERAARATARPLTAPRPRAPEPPRLTIGRIEVEVVAPRPAPTQPPAPREPRAARTAPGAAAPAATNLGILTFGLRQR